jgi:cytochrome P450 family 28
VNNQAIKCSLPQLANNKRAQEKLREQINEELIDANGKIIYEKMLEHEFLDQVMYETLRLHPIVGVFNRECTEEITLDYGKGNFRVEKGVSLSVPIYCIHRDPDHFTNPEEFIPERFDPENGGVKEFRNRGVLMPFGDGSRICLGMRFAIMQSKAAVVEIIRNFDLSVNVKTQRPLVLEAKQFFHLVEGGLWLDMKAIK